VVGDKVTLHHYTIILAHPGVLQAGGGASVTCCVVPVMLMTRQSYK